MKSLENSEKEGQLRSNEVLDEIIREAIVECIDVFASQMTERDKQMLMSVVREGGDMHPLNRIIYLGQISDAYGVSEDINEYVIQIKQTLKQKFNSAEIKVCQAPFGGSLLD
jgi:hypothetical protein